MATKRVKYTFICGHVKHYWTTVGRNMRFSHPCTACKVRQERALPEFLDMAHGLFMSIGRCIDHASKLRAERRRR